MDQQLNKGKGMRDKAKRDLSHISIEIPKSVTQVIKEKSGI